MTLCTVYLTVRSTVSGRKLPHLLSVHLSAAPRQAAPCCALTKEDIMAGLVRVPVVLSATDPISKVGLAAALRGRDELQFIEEAESGPASVIMTVVDRLDDAVIRELRARQARGQTRLVLITTELADVDLVVAVELGVRGVVLRADATPEVLVRLVRTAASGDATLPPDLLGRLLTQVSRLQRDVLAPRGL